MKACTRTVYGPAEVLSLDDVEQPTPGDDEVLVRVEASSTDPGAWHMMTGRPYVMRPVIGLRAPKVQIMGRPFAGVVTAAGADVTRLRPGDAVFGTTSSGSWAEYTVAPERLVAARPENVSAEQAAAAAISGVTALQTIRLADVRAGQRVLVIGAGGGVGSYAVQLAAHRGARVTAVCSASKRELVTSLGADEVVDYAVAEVDAHGPVYDVVVDTAGNRPLSVLRRALTPSGVLALVGGENNSGLVLQGFQRVLFAPLVGAVVRRRMRGVVSRENADDLAEVGRMLASGELTSVISRTYPLAEAAESIRHVTEGHPAGKVVLTLTS